MIKSLGFTLLVCCLQFQAKIHAQATVIRYEASFNQPVILHSWVTAKGSTCSDLTIQASNDLIQFYEIFRYAGICGSTDEELSYSWSQTNADPGQWYFRIVENGTIYSDTLAVTVFNQTQQLQVFPNPTQRLSKILLPNNWNPKEVLYYLYAPDGRRFSPKIVDQNELSIDVSSLTDGIYLLCVQRGEDTFNTRLLVQNQ
jgi:hypothetical protein